MKWFGLVYGVKHQHHKPSQTFIRVQFIQDSSLFRIQFKQVLLYTQSITFMKAFFSKACIINGGVTVKKQHHIVKIDL